MLDVVKIALGLVLFGVLAPAYGYICSRYPRLIRTNLLIIAFCSSLPVNRWTFQIASVEWYRGHTRGFEINLLVALAASSLIGLSLSRQEVKLWLPSIGAYLSYVALATLSIFNALDPSFTLMATFKFASIALIMVAAFNCLRSVQDFRAVQSTIAVALIWQLLYCLRVKYIDGVYRVQGFFPHPNNLGMYAYISALYLLPAVLNVKIIFRRRMLLGAGYLCGMALAFITISRASFAAAIGGSACIFALSVLLRPSITKVAVTSALLVPLAAGVAIVSDQIFRRFGGPSSQTRGVGSFREILEFQAQSMLSDQPFGIGWNNFCLANSRPEGDYSFIFEEYMRVVHGYSLTPEMASANPLIENLYWMVLGETGYLAFAALLLFGALLLSYAVRSVWFYRSHELGASTIAMSVLLPVLYLHAYLERILADTSVLVLFLILAGFTARMFWWRREIRRGRLTLAQLSEAGRSRGRRVVSRRR